MLLTRHLLIFTDPLIPEEGPLTRTASDIFLGSSDVRDNGPFR